MKAMRRTALDLLRHTRQTAMRDLKVVSDYTYWMDGEMLEDIRSTSTCLGVLQYNLKKGLTYDDHVGRLKPTILNKWKMEGRRFTIGQPLPGVVHRKQKKEEGDAHVLVLVTCTSSESGRNADLEDQEAVKEAIEIAGGTGLSRLLLGL